MSLVWVGLGSNLGDRAGSLGEALHLMEEAGLHVLRASHLYESVPEGGKDEPLYLNGVAQVESDRTPEEILRLLRSVEERMGRPPEHTPGPRTCDLDLLAVDDRRIDTATLHLPHPRMHDRVFVLVPLCEIDPHWRHPVLHQSAAELLAGLDVPRRSIWLYEGPVLERQASDVTPCYPWHSMSPGR